MRGTFSKPTHWPRRKTHISIASSSRTEPPVNQSSPVQLVTRLPYEILGEIFLFAVVEQFYADADLVNPKIIPVIHHLAQVCRGWRDAGRRCPRAWTFITLPLSFLARHAKYHLNRVKEALHFSKAVEQLHVRIFVTSQADMWTAQGGTRMYVPRQQKIAQDELLRHSRRWKHLTVVAADPRNVTSAIVEATCMQPISSMPLLESVHARFLGADRTAQINTIFFDLAPNLRRFRLASRSHFHLLKLPCQTLESLSFTKSNSLLTLSDLHLCKRLEHFQFSYQTSSAVTQARLNDILHSDVSETIPTLLRTLSIIAEGAADPPTEGVSLAAALSRFRTPELATLRIHSTTVAWFGTGAIPEHRTSTREERKRGVGVSANLLSYNPLALPPTMPVFLAQAVGLTTLELKCDHLTEWMLTECIRAAPGLLHLSVGRTQTCDAVDYSIPLGNGLIRRLTKDKGHPNEIPIPLLVPVLETLDIEGQNFSLTLFADMLDSRCCRRELKWGIRAVTLRLLPISPDEEDVYRSKVDLLRLEELEEDFIRVVVIDFADLEKNTRMEV